MRHRERLLAKAHYKIGAARKILNEFWATPNAAAPYDRKTAWAMHVALVRLERILRRGAK